MTIDISKYSIDATKFTFDKPEANSIIFYNGGGALQENEVMRIDRHGVRVNKKITTDEAVDAVIRALDGYIKGLAQKEYERGIKDALEEKK